eukprot:TRINITY_DN52149_c0_g1_i1.p1 TRINITY_DN52149_c0_g1~~TRINITY_DN52149_c0_g1_i1.p1  ORF type:complete len:352 (-),score=58.72 TRINITY_DN52149_c0_g1_i1:61-1077(-)
MTSTFAAVAPHGVQGTGRPSSSASSSSGKVTLRFWLPSLSSSESFTDDSQPFQVARPAAPRVPGQGGALDTAMWPMWQIGSSAQLPFSGSAIWPGGRMLPPVDGQGPLRPESSTTVGPREDGPAQAVSWSDRWIAPSSAVAAVAAMAGKESSEKPHLSELREDHGDGEVSDMLVEQLHKETLVPRRTLEVLWEKGILQQIPRDENGEITSAGSIRHHTGSCSSCLFWLKQYCSKGIQCNYCHIRHSGQKKKRIRPSRRTRQEMRARKHSQEEAAGRDLALKDAAAPSFAEADDDSDAGGPFAEEEAQAPGGSFGGCSTDDAPAPQAKGEEKAKTKLQL